MKFKLKTICSNCQKKEEFEYKGDYTHDSLRCVDCGARLDVLEAKRVI